MACNGVEDAILYLDDSFCGQSWNIWLPCCFLHRLLHMQWSRFSYCNEQHWRPNNTSIPRYSVVDTLASKVYLPQKKMARIHQELPWWKRRKRPFVLDWSATSHKLRYQPWVNICLSPHQSVESPNPSPSPRLAQ